MLLQQQARKSISFLLIKPRANQHIWLRSRALNVSCCRKVLPCVWNRAAIVWLNQAGGTPVVTQRKAYIHGEAILNSSIYGKTADMRVWRIWRDESTVCALILDRRRGSIAHAYLVQVLVIATGHHHMTLYFINISVTWLFALLVICMASAYMQFIVPGWSWCRWSPTLHAVASSYSAKFNVILKAAGSTGSVTSVLPDMSAVA